MATRDRHSTCGSSDHVSVNEVNVDTEPSPSTREQVFAKLQKESTVNSPLPLRICVTSCLSQRLRTDHWGSWRGSGQEPSEAYHISTETRGD
ncbi:hypothetical protein DPX16_12358 [Anabarilius grahami]|uniref:Uncharacterized protein n=1 Tax=Anabarilius grahami TaxID=495550 RepID=A0A3N0XFX8_ANAGA|nr:hypothetical protein DPX16_12358 [Anabarilius grahami]